MTEVKMPLTRKEQLFLQTIKSQIEASNVWPSYGELMGKLGLKSDTSVCRYYSQLQKKGWLKKVEGLRGCYEVVK